MKETWAEANARDAREGGPGIAAYRKDIPASPSWAITGAPAHEDGRGPAIVEADARLEVEYRGETAAVLHVVAGRHEIGLELTAGELRALGHTALALAEEATR